MKPARWASSSSLAALALWLLPCATLAANAPITVDAAQFLLSDAAEPPPDSAPWHPQLLPDNWAVSRPKVYGFGWYRLQVDLARQPDHPYAVYIPWMRTVGAVYVNGVEVGRTGPFEEPQTAPRPQFFNVPQHFLHAGTNQVDMRLLARQNWRAVLSPVTLGEDNAVRPLYERRLFWQVTGPQIVSFLSTVLGLAMLLLWLRRPHESMYGYFGLAALVWAANMVVIFLVVDPPVPIAYWSMLRGFLASILPILLFLFVLRYAGWRWPRAERWLWAWGAVTLLMVYLEVFHSGGWLARPWYRTELGLILIYCSILTYVAWRRRFLERTLVIAAVLFLVGSIAYELITTELLGSLDTNLLYPYRALPLYLAIGWILLDRFVRSLNEQEKLNAELEQRVAQKHAELEQNYQRMREMERQRAVASERQRIMSDMHDGLGGQLMSTLGLVEQGEVSSAEVAAALRECIDDLRLTIDSLEPTENDLLPVLGNLRYRLDGRLKKQGIDLDWQVREVPKLSCLTPHNVLHILRILQEAFTNVVKHAQASIVSVETGVGHPGGRVFIRVRDNGTGFSGDHSGHGLTNMRRRAQIIGARLEIRPSLDGTTLNLELPAG